MISEEEALTLVRGGFASWVTAGLGRFDHAVIGEAFAEGLANDSGEFVAVCGAVLLPAAMTATPKPYCPQCVALLRARNEIRDHQRPTAASRHRRRFP